MHQKSMVKCLHQVHGSMVQGTETRKLHKGVIARRAFYLSLVYFLRIHLLVTSDYLLFQTVCAVL